MEMRNCPKCGKIFAYTAKPICKSCEQKEEETFETIRDYMEQNPTCNLGELSEATGVSPKLITRFIREGRLQITSGLRGEITCESCGKPILTGRYCEDCFLQVSREVEALFSKEPGKAAAKMHHITARKKL
jgi:flagellar operon protein (TIGR03826 family)